jgi:hypothetical protein
MKILLLVLTLVSLQARAELTVSDLKKCAYSSTKSKFFSIPGKTNVVYKFKGNDVYRITLPAQPGPFSASAMSKGVCFDREHGEGLETKECKNEARAVLKLDGYSLNEVYEAVMGDYKDQISEFMDSASGTEKEDLFVQAGEAKDLAKRLEHCKELGPLSTYAKKKQKEALDASDILKQTYGIKDDAPASAPKGSGTGAGKSIR